MTQFRRILGIILTLIMITSFATPMASAASRSANGVIVADLGELVELVDLTDSECSDSCTWRVIEGSNSEINWIISSGSANGVTNKVGHFYLELQGTETEVVDGHIVATNTYSSTYSLHVLGHQTVEFINPISQVYLSAGIITVVAVATSGWGVTYSSKTPDVCVVDSESGRVTLKLVGRCEIEASQPGDNYAWDDADEELYFEILSNPNIDPIPNDPNIDPIPNVAPTPMSKRDQVITLTVPSKQVFRSGMTVQTSARLNHDTPLPIIFTSLSDKTNICDVDSASGVASIFGPGICVIQAVQAGNEQFNYTSDVESFLIEEAELVVTLLPRVVTYDGQSKALIPSARAASCTTTYNGSRIAPTNAGTYSVVSTCSRNGSRSSATSTLVIEKAKPKITWFDPASITTVTKLTKVQLNATADVPGTFSYGTNSRGSRLPQGTQPLKTIFTPRDSRNYEVAQANVNIVVTRIKLETIVIPFDLGSSNLTASTRSIVAQIRNSGATAVTIFGYVKPSRSLTADQKLSLDRANQVREAVLELMPDIQVSVRAMDRTRNPLCDFAENKCAVITE